MSRRAFFRNQLPTTTDETQNTAISALLTRMSSVESRSTELETDIALKASITALEAEATARAAAIATALANASPYVTVVAARINEVSCGIAYTSLRAGSLTLRNMVDGVLVGSATNIIKTDTPVVITLPVGSDVSKLYALIEGGQTVRSNSFLGSFGDQSLFPPIIIKAMKVVSSTVTFSYTSTVAGNYYLRNLTNNTTVGGRLSYFNLPASSTNTQFTMYTTASQNATYALALATEENYAIGYTFPPNYQYSSTYATVANGVFGNQSLIV